MARQRNEEEFPACYAIVHPGLEEVAGEEVRTELKGEVKRAEQGIVVFRLPEIDRSILRLRTTEDVYLHAWGTDQLTYRAVDLENIQRWTSRDVDWAALLRIHHAIRPKPKGKPTYRLVVQMTGEHAYHRVEARKAFARGLAGKFPPSWRPAEEDAAVEFWLTIHGATAIAGLRLSDRTMRHREYKIEHFPASLRPTMAAALVRLAELKPHHVVLDPMCGAGTILAEAWLFARQQERPQVPWNLTLYGGDIDPHHLRAAKANLHALVELPLRTWDARRLPLEDASVDRIICNLPFGKQLSSPEEIGPLYREVAPEMDRVLRSKGKAVLLVAEAATLRAAARAAMWKQERFLPVRVLGQKAAILVYRKA